MNQTKKRLTIINLAISMTDDETIQDQIIRLEPLKSDEKLQEIIGLLRTQNYGQAQRYIKNYLVSDDQSIVQRTLQEEPPPLPTVVTKTESSISQEDQDIIEKFDLFVTTPESEKNKSSSTKKEVRIDDFLSSLPDKKAKSMPTVDFNEMLDIHLGEYVTDNKEEDNTNISTDTFFKDALEKEHSDTQNIKKDNFFAPHIQKIANESEIEIPEIPVPELELPELDLPDIDLPEIKAPKLDLPDIEKIEDIKMPEIPMDDISVSKKVDTMVFAPNIDTRDDIDTEQIFKDEVEDDYFNELPPPLPTTSPINKHAETHTTIRPIVDYKNISYIDDKFASMLKKYPTFESKDGSFASVKVLKEKIKEDGYSDEDIEETIDYINIIRKEGKHSEASQLLLLCASTESKFGQFMLARELFKGQIVEKNMSESFSMMNSLALEGFPEALCDLGQFYEDGLGIYRDVKKAGALYKEAQEHGIKRAEKHYTRIRQQYKKLF
jgi:hypothetical protein